MVQSVNTSPTKQIQVNQWVSMTLGDFQHSFHSGISDINQPALICFPRLFHIGVRAAPISIRNAMCSCAPRMIIRRIHDYIYHFSSFFPGDLVCFPMVKFTHTRLQTPSKTCQSNDGCVSKQVATQIDWFPLFSMAELKLSLKWNKHASCRLLQTNFSKS